MKKILFLPLLQMQSGHHQVAEALMDMLKEQTEGIILKKIDLLSYTNKSLEKVISNGYLKWIRYAPESYNLAYKSFFYLPPAKRQNFKWYQPLFMKKLEQLLEEEKPDLLVCTHGFPSCLLSRLKMKGKCNIPIINVYTDFFINNFWGRDGIDIHFLPSQDVKDKLSKKYNIPNQQMIVTGIPVHREITRNNHSQKQSIRRPKVLVAGGNSGLGGILKLAEELKRSNQVDYFVLCGNNQKLYDEILSWEAAHIKPLPYLSSRAEMNRLYDKVDAIMTKPGGVTISEALHKSLPIFVHGSLPGQEEINLHYLKERELVFELDQNVSLEQQLLDVLLNKEKMNQLDWTIQSYQKEIELVQEGIVNIIETILGQKTKSVKSIVVSSSNVFHMAGA